MKKIIHLALIGAVFAPVAEEVGFCSGTCQHFASHRVQLGCGDTDLCGLLHCGEPFGNHEPRTAHQPELSGCLDLDRQPSGLVGVKC